MANIARRGGNISILASYGGLTFTNSGDDPTTAARLLTGGGGRVNITAGSYRGSGGLYINSQQGILSDSDITISTTSGFTNWDSTIATSNGSITFSAPYSRSNSSSYTMSNYGTISTDNGFDQFLVR